MNFRYKLMQFMSGRYGLDSTFYVIFLVSAALSVVNCFVRSYILQIVVYALVIFAFYRVMSRNINARAKENRAVQGMINKIKAKIDTSRQRRADFNHIYRKCPRCKAVLRLPRKKGKHTTVCPKCNNSFKVRVYK